MSREIANQVLLFIEARFELMKIYEEIANSGASMAQMETAVVTAANSETQQQIRHQIEQIQMDVDSELYPKIADIFKKYHGCLPNALLTPLNELFAWELEALKV